jgi:hypothetical protein
MQYASYSPYETAHRAALKKAEFDIDEFDFEVISRLPVISEYTTINSRLVVTTYAVRVPYSTQIASSVLHEIPYGKDVSGAHWISAKTLLSREHSRLFRQRTGHSSMWQEHRDALARSVHGLGRDDVTRTEVFFSFSGNDRARALPYAQALGKCGLRVFTDQDIVEGEGITPKIQMAPQNAKALVAYYSKDFAECPASQRELICAFVASQSNGGSVLSS